MPRKRDGVVPLGDVAGAVELPGGRALTHRAAASPGAASLHTPRPGETNSSARAKQIRISASWRGYSHCAACAHEPRRPASVRARQRTVQAGYGRRGWKQTALRQHPAPTLAWVCTEAVRTQNRDLLLGPVVVRVHAKTRYGGSAAAAHEAIGARLQNQMKRLFRCTISLVYEDAQLDTSVISPIADRAEFWWSARLPTAPSLWDSTIRLGEELFNEIIAHPIPLDMNTLRSLKRSPLGLDLYLWLTCRTFSLQCPMRLSWRRLYQQFGWTRLRLETSAP